MLKILNVFDNAGHRISGETEISFFSTDKWSKWRLVDDFTCSFVITITLFLPRKGLYDRALLKELNIINKTARFKNSVLRGRAKLKLVFTYKHGTVQFILH